MLDDKCDCVAPMDNQGTYHHFDNSQLFPLRQHNPGAICEDVRLADSDGQTIQVQVSAVFTTRTEVRCFRNSARECLR